MELSKFERWRLSSLLKKGYKVYISLLRGRIVTNLADQDQSVFIIYPNCNECGLKLGKKCERYTGSNCTFQD